MFMLLLMFAVVSGLIIAYFDYNISAQEQMTIEHERSQEKIILSKLQVDDQFRILNIIVNNTGSIEVRIRALYEILNGETTFLFDPSNYMDTHIAPSKSLSIYIPSEIPEILFDPQAKIVVATERGVKTLDYEPILLYEPAEPPTHYDPTKLYIGPLMLKFDDFQYRKTNKDGVLDPDDPWHPGWSIPKGFGYCAWKISVMDIDDRNITINSFSSFNAVPSESPATTLSWYLEPTNQTSRTQFLQVNKTESVLYIWSGPGLGANAQQMNLPGTRTPTCMVFLTFFGVFHEHDGTTTPYAQTIPFEASITIT